MKRPLLWLLLVVPFVAVAVWTRARAPRWADGIAHTLYEIVASPPEPPAPPPSPPSEAAIESPLAVDDARDASADASDAGLARRAEAALARAIDAGSKDDTSPITLSIKADAVDKALAHAGSAMHGRTARDASGKAIGVRLTGVSARGVGLRDGDLIVAIEGVPTMDDDAATDIIIGAIAHGKTVIHASLLRGARPIDLTVEVPLDAAAAEKDAGRK